MHCGFVPLMSFHKKASSGPVSRVLCTGSFDLACLSFIYSASHLAALAFYPPSLPKHRAGSPQTTVYANLQPPAGTAQWSPTGWWSLTSPSPPYSHKGGGRSLLPEPAVTDSFYFRKWRALCCPDFPLANFSASDRPDYCLRPTKLVQTEDRTK